MSGISASEKSSACTTSKSGSEPIMTKTRTRSDRTPRASRAKPTKAAAICARISPRSPKSASSAWNTACASTGTSCQPLVAAVANGSECANVGPSATSHRESAPMMAKDASAAARMGTTLRGDDVDPRQLRAQVEKVRHGVDLRRPDRTLERLRRCELAAVAVQVLAEPVPERREVALLERVVEVRQVGRDPLPDLRRDQVAERVGREVAD